MPEIETTELRRSLARELRTRREKRGWTQAEAARRAGIGRAYWGLLEAGDRWPSDDVLERIARLFGVRVRSLL